MQLLVRLEPRQYSWNFLQAELEMPKCRLHETCDEFASSHNGFFSCVLLNSSKATLKTIGESECVPKKSPSIQHRGTSHHSFSCEGISKKTTSIFNCTSSDHILLRHERHLCTNAAVAASCCSVGYRYCHGATADPEGSGIAPSSGSKQVSHPEPSVLTEYVRTFCYISGAPLLDGTIFE